VRYVVTGGAGFIGSHLVERLVRDGAEVVVLDDFSTGKRDNLTPWLDQIEIIEGSVTDMHACARAVQEADFVLHQAARPSVPRSLRDPLGSHDVNATGTLVLLMAAREAGDRRVIYASSSSVYGDTPDLPKRENATPHPRSPYAVSKLTGEHYCLAFTASFRLETVVLRYFNVYGPRQDPDSPYAAVIPRFVAAALAGEPPEITGDGEQTRDFTHVTDVVEANLLVCETPGIAASVFNVGAAVGSV
jgi:UDP-glucose 4-epimerase